MRKITPTIFFLFIAAFFLNSCSKGSLSSLVIGTDQDEQVGTREIKQERFQITTVFKGKNSLQESYAHPINLSAEMVLAVMKEMKFQTREYSEYIKTKKSEWSIPRALFDEADLPAITTAIAQIFTQLNSKEEVYFYIDSQIKVEGKTYIAPDGWYWYFRTINGKRPKHSRVSSIKEWKIHLKPNERYLVTHTGYSLKKVNVNWISIPLSKEIRSEIQKKYQKGSEKNINNYKLKEAFATEPPAEGELNQKQQIQDIEVLDKKVLILNKLKEDGIITEDEYQSKVRKVLKKEL